MRTLNAAAILAILTAPAYGQIGPPDKMGGTGYAKQFGKTCSGYANTCVQNNPGKTDKCQSARAKCMETGTFVGPQGRSFSGLAKQ
jgi:hypothetical protein